MPADPAELIKHLAPAATWRPWQGLLLVRGPAVQEAIRLLRTTKHPCLGGTLWRQERDSWWEKEPDWTCQRGLDEPDKDYFERSWAVARSHLHSAVIQVEDVMQFRLRPMPASRVELETWAEFMDDSLGEPKPGTLVVDVNPRSRSGAEIYDQYEDAIRAPGSASWSLSGSHRSAPWRVLGTYVLSAISGDTTVIRARHMGLPNLPGEDLARYLRFLAEQAYEAGAIGGRFIAEFPSDTLPRIAQILDSARGHL